ncbi:MAG: quercetin 2,3-dioxygenase [Myxococcales bacterium]|jgi:redox-sensitive bicupin YhaK (pirin superfamily)|nr:quercetin 2,3-dioxygenase [Myxococcales bacterium]
MIQVRPAAERGTTRIDWLDSRHSFSFGEYYDPSAMGFRSLRVINDDRVAPGGGFPTHGHSDMEIVSYVLDGSLEHRDSLGTGSVIRPGDVQRMTAGTGVRHSEFNGSRSEPVRFLQIWILPEKRSLAPGYEQKSYSAADKRGRLRLVASRDGRDDSVTVHQDVDVYAGILQGADRLTFQPPAGRSTWVQVARGAVMLNGHSLSEGDGAAIQNETTLELTAAGHPSGEAEVLVLDLA